MELRLERIPKSIELVRRGDEVLLEYIDERFLPDELLVRRTGDWSEVVDAIKTLAVRGAPAIGIAGGAALALWANRSDSLAQLEEVAEAIATARPTAVNLRWCVDRVRTLARSRIEAGEGAEQVSEALFEAVRGMQEDDERANRTMGACGAALLPDCARLLTHCNAGSLATYYYGTALGVVYAAAELGKVERVYADETRPVGQGARLTAWELSRAGVPVTLICDNMAASLMARNAVDAVVVGADRIASNGDTANKIGTYGLAVLAHEHGVPFYVVAPTSTIDWALDDGSGIVIEERDAGEVLPRPIEGVDVWNPAFDVTPARYIEKIVTELGAFDPSRLAECKR